MLCTRGCCEAAVLIQNMTQKKIAQISKKIIQVKQLPEVHQKIFKGELEQKGGGENHCENYLPARTLLQSYDRKPGTGYRTVVR